MDSPCVEGSSGVAAAPPAKGGAMATSVDHAQDKEVRMCRIAVLPERPII